MLAAFLGVVLDSFFRPPIVITTSALFVLILTNAHNIVEVLTLMEVPHSMLSLDIVVVDLQLLPVFLCQHPKLNMKNDFIVFLNSHFLFGFLIFQIE